MSVCGVICTGRRRPDPPPLILYAEKPDYVSRGQPLGEAREHALLHGRPDAVDAYAQSVLCYPEPRGQLLPVVYLGALVVLVVLQQQLPVGGRQLAHAAVEARVLALGLLRLV